LGSQNGLLQRFIRIHPLGPVNSVLEVPECLQGFPTARSHDATEGRQEGVAVFARQVGRSCFVWRFARQRGRLSTVLAGGYHTLGFRVQPSIARAVDLARNLKTQQRQTRRIVMNDNDTRLEELKKIVQDFVDQREWRPFHNPKNLAMAIAIESAELMEHFQWLRTDELASIRKDDEQMGMIREELADILAFVISFANAMEIDLSAALVSKMRKNAAKYPVDQFKGRFR
jgi:NTP pyrophosphatase (non-canonical NTP hydrolase)